MRVTSRRHRMLGVLLVAAMLALAVDTFTGGPEDAPAAPAPIQPDATESNKTAQVIGRAQALLAQLRTQGANAGALRVEAHALRDLFLTDKRVWPQEAPPVERPSLAKKPAGKPPDRSGPTSPEAPPFTQTHVLRGVVCGPAPLALVNETIVSRGGVIDGYRVVEIQRDRVRLRAGGRLVTLMLAGPGKSAPVPGDVPPVAAGEKKKTDQIKSILDLVDLLSGK